MGCSSSIQLFKFLFSAITSLPKSKILLLVLTISKLSAEDMTEQQSFYIGSLGIAYPKPQFCMLTGKINPNFIGWFAEFRGGFGMPREVEYDSTAKWIEQSLGYSIIEEKNMYSSYLLGITYLVNPTIVAYLGLGMTKLINYNRYSEPFNDGKYWIEDDMEHETITSFTAGIILNKIKFRNNLFLTTSLSILSSPFNFGISIGTKW